MNILWVISYHSLIEQYMYIDAIFIIKPRKLVENTKYFSQYIKKTTIQCKHSITNNKSTQEHMLPKMKMERRKMHVQIIKSKEKS
jgi:hypothetical protein